jgi:hypothetical protein
MAMTVSFVPLLRVQRDLYGLPRGMERFHAYIKAMRRDVDGDLDLPLVAMNPMGKDHVPALLDGWLALDADDLAARAVARTLGYPSLGFSERAGLALALADVTS